VNDRNNQGNGISSAAPVTRTMRHPDRSCPGLAIAGVEAGKGAATTEKVAPGP
jgi:hypothetical protein